MHLPQTCFFGSVGGVAETSPRHTYCGGTKYPALYALKPWEATETLGIYRGVSLALCEMDFATIHNMSDLETSMLELGRPKRRALRVVHLSLDHALMFREMRAEDFRSSAEVKAVDARSQAEHWLRQKFET